MTRTPVSRVATVLLLAALVAAPTASAATSAGPWAWPVGSAASPPPVLRPFDQPERPWLAGHRGVDLAADAGATVRAAGAGVVSYAGGLAGRGVVAVVHDGLRTTYEPVAATVSVGRRVAAGDPVGVLEEPRGHCAPRPCLHWGLRRGDTYLDPLALVSGGPARLLPLGEAASGVVAGSRSGGEPHSGRGGPAAAPSRATDPPAGARRGGAALAGGAALGLAAGSAAVALRGRRVG